MMYTTITMTSFGLLVMNAYTNWVSIRQKKVAEVRVKNKLEKLLQYRGSREFLVAHWSILIDNTMYPELRRLEEDWNLRLQLALDNLEDDEVVENVSFEERKRFRRDILYKYVGEELANEYIQRYGLNARAIQLLMQLYRLVHVM